MKTAVQSLAGTAIQNLAGAATQNLAGAATQTLAGAGTQSLVGAVTRSLAGTTRAASAKAKAATGAGVSTRKAEEIQMAEARSQTAHLAGLPHHHLAVVAEVEAEAMAGDLALAQSLLATARATRGTALTSTEPTTLARSALAG